MGEKFIDLMRDLRDQFLGKVDKVDGKGLSSNDYTTIEKNKLSTIEQSANNYTHPASHPVAIIDGQAYPLMFVKTDANGNTGFGYVSWGEITGKPADMDNVEFTTNKGVANGYAPLGANGKIDPNFIDSLNAFDTFFPADIASMLLLNAGLGDFAFVPVGVDEAGDTIYDNYQLGALPASTQSNWKKINIIGVSSVNGKHGVVVLSSDDISEGIGNLYFTNERVDDRVASLLTAGTNITITYDDVTGAIMISADDVSVEFAQLQNKPTTLDGYGITDAYTKTETDTNIANALASLVDASPSTLDTLNELAAALGDDPAFATTITTLIGTKAPLNAPVFTGYIGLPKWTTTTRPMLGAGDTVTGFNTDTLTQEIWNGTEWVAGNSALGISFPPSGNLTSTNVEDTLIELDSKKASIDAVPLIKPIRGEALFTKASVSTLTIPVGTKVLINTTLITVSGNAYTLSLNSVGVGALDTGIKAAGTDYYVYALEAGGFIISANATNPTGYTTANSKLIGGFHYGVIPEAFAAINNITSADATKIAGINAYSFWDLKYRPSCGDARGMFKANTGKWYDIYLLNVDHHTYGTSAAGKTIAGGTVLNGRNFPKIPLFYGGNGTTTYGTLTWFEAAEIGKAYGKDLISYEEFAAIAYGVLEASSASTADTGITQHLANYTSKFGVCMATGCQYIWGKDLIGPLGAAWNTNTEGRGSIYNASLIAALFGGYRDLTVESGSRCSICSNYVWNTSWIIGCRYACDHLELA